MKNKTFHSVDKKNPFGAQTKMLWHMDRLCSFKEKGSAFPVHVEISPTNRCNMSCEWCISSYLRGQETLDIKVLKRFLREFHDLGGKAIGWSGGGEPTQYPDFVEAIKEASDIGLKQGLFTNGLFKKSLIETIGENMVWVRLALDTTDKKSFAEKKCVSENALGKVLSNIKGLSEYPARLITNTELAKWNANHMENFVKVSRQYGANIAQIRPVLPRPYKAEKVDRDFYADYLPKLKQLEKMGDDNFQVFISWDKFEDFVNGKIYGRSYDKCQYHHFFCVLNANGDLGVCMYRLNDPNFIFGNIYETSLEGIWSGKKRKEVIKHCNEKMDFSKCQVCCKGHELNKFLHSLQNPILGSDPDFF